MREMISKPILENRIIKGDMEEIYSRNYDWSMFKGSSFLVTGAYGMLASYIVLFLVFLREFKSIDLEIYAQGRSEEKARARFGDYLDRDYFHFVQEDILSESGGSIPQTEYIVHAAGIANPRLYSTNPVEVIEPNVIGTHRLLKSCSKERTKGFLFFSTGDVYGKVIDNYDITEETMGVLDPLDAHSCYGESKRVAETICSAFYKEYGIRTIIARIGHTYGPTMDIYNDPRVFASFMQCVVENKDIEMLSDGLAKRPFCYIADATAAFMLLLLNGKGGEAYNMGNSKEFLSISELAEIMRCLNMNKKISVVYKNRENADSYLETKVNKDNRIVEYKLNQLGWSCNYSAREGFQRVYNYLQSIGRVEND